MAENMPSEGQAAALPFSPRVPFRLTPSRLARFYFHECERFLRYASTPAARRMDDGVPKPGIDRSLLTRTILDSGYAWESTVVQQYLGSSAIIAPGPPGAPVHERKHSPEQT